MSKTKRYSLEVKEREVLLMQEARNDYPSLWSVIESIAPKIGRAAITLREWIKRHEIYIGLGGGMASAFFAQGELDRLKKK